jgi:hypothetical protein
VRPVGKIEHMFEMRADEVAGADVAALADAWGHRAA